MWKVVIISTLAAVTCAVPAAVASPTAAHPAEPLATESSKLVGQPRISHRQVDGATQARSVSCNDVTYMRWMHNSWGMILAKIWNHSHWCYNGSRITSVTGWTDTYTAPGWDVSDATWNAQLYTQPIVWMTRARARFVLSVAGEHVQTYTPDVCVLLGLNGSAKWC